MRISLGADLDSRDGTLTRDAKCVNAVIEITDPQTAFVSNRPGNTDLGLLRAGTAQLLVFWNGLKAIIGDFLNTTGSSTLAYTRGTPTVNAWTARTLPSSTTWMRVAYGNGIYLAISQSGAVAKSVDGITWTAGTSITARTWFALSFNGTVFCAIANDATPTATTADGVTWNQTGNLPATGFYALASNGNGLFVATNFGQNAATSTDGVTWTNQVGVMPSSVIWQYMTWNGTVFCATDGTALTTKAATSVDGVTWTARTLPLALQTTNVIGGGGIIIVTVVSGTAVSVSSDHGVTWTTGTIPFSQTATQAPVAWNGTAFLIAAGGVSTLAAMSVDGITWTSTVLAGTGAKTGAASNRTGFVVVEQTATVSEATSVTYLITTVSTNLSPTNAGLQFSAQDNGSNAGTQYLMLKNANQAWTLTNAVGAVPVLVTDVDYPGTYAVTLTSLTRAGTVATATTTTNTNFQVGSSIVIAGATPIAYNGAQTVTGVTASSVTTIGPATVTITRIGTTATAVSVNPHGFSNGQSITIAGATQIEYNGTYVIVWNSATSFSFTVAVTGAALPVSPATGSPVIIPVPVNIQFANTSGAPTVFTGSNKDSPGPNDIFVNGQILTITFSNNGGMVPNGAYTLSGVSGNTFQITATGGTFPGNFSATGVITPAVVSSITRSGTTATVTTSTAHNYYTGKLLGYSGAAQYQYNASFRPITVISSTTFTYELSQVDTPASPATGTITAKYTLTVGASFTFTIAGSPATPATGTVTATGGRNTVPGIEYVNGYFLVADVYGVLYSSDPDNPTSWGALNYTSADSVSGAAKALARTLNYPMVFKEWSVEPFYDRQDGNPIGSPFSKLQNGLLLTGCASGASLAKMDGAIYWISQTREEGRGVHLMIDTQAQKISTPSVDRVLKMDSLSEVHAWAMKINGHGFYILTLVNTNVTLVYDASSSKWSEWSSLTLGASVSVSSITLVGTTATVTTATAHNLADGEPVNISGAVQTGYNGIRQISYLTATTFTIQVAAGLVTPATGTILAFPYITSYLKFTHFANALGNYMTLHTSNGHLYQFSANAYQDAGIPIPVFFRTARMDDGALANKMQNRITIIGDSLADTMMVRQSDDDFATVSKYRWTLLSYRKPMIRGLGSYERRTLEFKYIGNNKINLKAVEIDSTMDR